MTAHITVILALTLSLLALPLPAYAQTNATFATTSATLVYPANIAPSSPQYTDLLLNNLFHTFGCLTMGSSVIGQPCLTYQVSQTTEGAVSSVPVLSSANFSGGALGLTTSLVGGLYTHPPLRTADYIASLRQNFNLVPAAHAQVGGSGAAVLSPILRLWQVSRNISYVVMIVIFMVIGFMVMFRQRINPQTVITAQAALPGLVIGLVLITFSYFLASLITDVAFLGTNLVGFYFIMAQMPSGATNDLLQILQSQNVLSIMSTFVGATGPGDLSAAAQAVLSGLQGMSATIINAAIIFLAYQYGSQMGPIALALPIGGPCLALSTVTLGAALAACGALVGVVGPVAGGSIAALYAFNNPANVVGIAIYVVLIAVLLYTMFRLLIRLITNYLTIILLTITAPFHFLAASLPGRQSIAVDWARNMLCNVLAFPAVIAVFYFVAFLLGGDATGLRTGRNPFPVGTAPGLTGDSNLPLFGGLDLGFIRLLLAFGALIATPAIPEIICRAIGKPSPAAQLFGQEIGAGIRAGQGYIARAGQAPGVITKDLGRLDELRTKYRTRIGPEGIVTTEVEPGLGQRIRPTRLTSEQAQPPTHPEPLIRRIWRRWRP